MGTWDCQWDGTPLVLGLESPVTSELTRTHPTPRVLPGVAGRARLRTWQVLGGLLVFAILCLIFASCAGSIAMQPTQWWHAIQDLLGLHPESLDASLLQLRLQRASVAFVTGSSLALAGVMMQALLRNPLADPYILGVSGGASVGALLAISCYASVWMVDMSAFGGAMLICALLYVLARRDLRSGIVESNASLLLLSGVIIATGCGAAVTLMLTIVPDGRLRGMVFWLMGDLSGAEARWSSWVILIGAIVFALRQSRAVNVLAMHADSARTLGISNGRLSSQLFFVSALLTASAVSNAGSIGFVGLIVPHACRFALGSDHRLLFPATALAGGSLLVLADTLARTVLAPSQLPVGVITALIGVPAFLLQLHQVRRRR